MSDEAEPERKYGNLPVPGPGCDTKYRVEFNDQVFKLCLLGATDKEIADFFEIDPTTFYRWQAAHPAFRQSCIAGKLPADAEVAHSYYRRATGEHVQMEKLVKKSDGTSEVVRYMRYVPCDPQAAQRWLLNRRRLDWGGEQQQDHRHSGVVETIHGEMPTERAAEIYQQTKDAL